METLFQILLVAFLVIPIVEIYLLFQVGGIIGAGWTILIVIATAIIGVNLLRQQGLSTLTRLNESLAQGQIPPTMLIEGILLLLSGAFLLTPGFFTDTLGFVLLVQPVRKILATYLLRRGVFMAAGMQSDPAAPSAHGRRSEKSSASQNNIIEGEYERRDDD